MNERVKFVAARLGAVESFSDTCERFGISRKTGYKWIDRYEHGGVEELADRSRAPWTHPHAVTAQMEALVSGVRRQHPTWGPRKLLVLLRRRHPELQLPAASTVGDILRREGLVRRRRRRIRRSSPYSDRLGGYDTPNAVWCADYKGHFPVAGTRCHPLTITDGFSRFLIRCEALPRQLSHPTRRVFESAFREFGLPAAIRTDNGAPFSSLTAGGLSRLAVWWIKLGIRPERITPGRPDQNGRHERMHRTLKAEACNPPRASFLAQQRVFDHFRDDYNNERPHEALDQQTPASLYTPSPRPFPTRVPDLEYPSHFRVERAYPNGVISFNSVQWYISDTLAGELVGLEEVDNERWRVQFGPINLGVLDMRLATERGRRGFGRLVRADGYVDGRRRRKLYRR